MRRAPARRPTLEPAGLKGGIVYQDGQFDDARLAVSLARTIDDHGGVALNYVAVTAFVKDADGRDPGASGHAMPK